LRLWRPWFSFYVFIPYLTLVPIGSQPLESPCFTCKQLSEEISQRVSFVFCLFPARAKPDKTTLEEDGSARFICLAIARLEKNLLALSSLNRKIMH
jgi:hypothetical protein